MKTSHWLSSLILIFTITVSLAACGITAPVPTATVTTLPSLTPLAIPTSRETPPPSSTSTLSAIPLSSPPDGLRMAYVVNGDLLYYQNGSNPPLQLTRGVPLAFSEDRKKVFFTRGVISEDIYSINVDGSEEQALVTNSLLPTFGVGYDTSTQSWCYPVHVPHSSLLLFTTCYRPDPQLLNIIINNDLFALNTDTHKVKRLLSKGQGGIFYVSPDGTMIAIDRQNAIDILGIDGKLIHRKIATYPHSEPFTLHAKMYWLSDSSELILALPINNLYDTSVPPTYAIKRYSLATNTAVEVKLDPPLMSNDENWISPDGHWITYNNFNEGFFLGDLQQGLTKPYPNPSLPHEWSPDSVHFIYETFESGMRELYLASVNAPPIFIGNGEFFGWLDASRYMYFINNTFVIGNIDGKSTPTLVGITPSIFIYPHIYEFLDH